jgi:hypothetical protein
MMTMMTFAVWQILALVFMTSCASFLLGVFVMAWVAMASYDGDELRSEEE